MSYEIIMQPTNHQKTLTSIIFFDPKTLNKISPDPKIKQFKVLIISYVRLTPRAEKCSNTVSPKKTLNFLTFTF